MSTGLSWLRSFGDMVHFLGLCLRPRTSLAKENLFLRKQLGFYQERRIKPRHADNPTRLTLVLNTALSLVPRGRRTFLRSTADLF